jgi:flagellar basal-body rod protein FlgB
VPGICGSSPTAHAIELAAQFAEERQRVLAENIANLETPDYHARQLDPDAFQKSLRSALERAHGAGGDERLELRDNAQFSTAAGGDIEVRPVEEPADNVLFHDGTNASLENLMTEATKNAASYELATNLLRGKFELLLKAIRGRS